MNKISENEKTERAALKERIIALKLAIGCEQCGYKIHPFALQFHHINPAQKIAQISELLAKCSVSENKIFEEIAKCVVLCANCHRIVTAAISTKKRAKIIEPVLLNTSEQNLCQVTRPPKHTIKKPDVDTQKTRRRKGQKVSVVFTCPCCTSDMRKCSGKETDGGQRFICPKCRFSTVLFNQIPCAMLLAPHMPIS